MKLKFNNRPQSICSLKRENDVPVIDLKISSPSEIYNPLDPDPDAEKDLNSSTVEYFLQAMEEVSSDERDRAKIVLYLENSLYQNEGLRSSMEHAIPSYFKKRLSVEYHKYLQEQEKGRRYLIRGMIFLIACIVLSSIIITVFGSSDVVYAIGQSFVVIGWVALWKPVEFYLYDNRDLKNHLNILHDLSSSPIESRTWSKNIEDETLVLM